MLARQDDEKKQNEEAPFYKIRNEIHELLGKGAFSSVYLGKADKYKLENGVEKTIKKEIPIALKELQSNLDEDTLRSIYNEISISLKLSDNSNIVKMIGLHDMNHKKFIAYEYCNGGDLRKYLDYFETFDEILIQAIMMQLVNGLIELFKKNVVHHDIKPENILLNLFYDEEISEKEKEKEKEKKRKIKKIKEILENKRNNNQPNTNINVNNNFINGNNQNPQIMTFQNNYNNNLMMNLPNNMFNNYPPYNTANIMFVNNMMNVNNPIINNNMLMNQNNNMMNNNMININNNIINNNMMNMNNNGMMNMNNNFKNINYNNMMNINNNMNNNGLMNMNNNMGNNDIYNMNNNLNSNMNYNAMNMANIPNQFNQNNYNSQNNYNNNFSSMNYNNSNVSNNLTFNNTNNINNNNNICSNQQNLVNANRNNQIFTKNDFLNILKNSTEYKLSDFGLSKLKTDIQKRNLCGSPLYMSPELFKLDSTLSEIENKKVDIWALGILAYELFFGKRPFEAFSIEELSRMFDKGTYLFNLRKKKGDERKISKEFFHFLNKCLQKDAEKRANVFQLRNGDFFNYDVISSEKMNEQELKEYLKGIVEVDNNGNFILNINKDYADEIKYRDLNIMYINNN